MTTTSTIEYYGFTWIVEWQTGEDGRVELTNAQHDTTIDGDLLPLLNNYTINALIVRVEGIKKQMESEAAFALAEAAN